MMPIPCHGAPLTIATMPQIAPASAAILIGFSSHRSMMIPGYLAPRNTEASAMATQSTDEITVVIQPALTGSRHSADGQRMAVRIVCADGLGGIHGWRGGRCCGVVRMDHFRGATEKVKARKSPALVEAVVVRSHREPDPRLDLRQLATLVQDSAALA